MKRALSILSVLFVLTFAAIAQSAAPSQNLEHFSKKQLNTLIATAKTPAEHRRIAQYFEAKSQLQLAESKEHEKMLASFNQGSIFSSSKFKTPTIDHCKYLVASLRNSSAKMHGLAQVHEQMAVDAEKN